MTTDQVARKFGTIRRDVVVEILLHHLQAVVHNTLLLADTIMLVAVPALAGAPGSYARQADRIRRVRP